MSDLIIPAWVEPMMRSLRPELRKKLSLRDIDDLRKSVESQIAAERERADKAEKALLVPGEMRCAKCKFTLIRTNLYVKSGTTGPGGSETEPCPNGCGPLWPETWERSARDAWARLETAHDELIAERERADRAETALATARQLAINNAEGAAKAVTEVVALRERVARLVGAATALEQSARRLMDAINAQFDAENPDEAREAGREPPPLDDAMSERDEAWISVARAIYYSTKARTALGDK